MYLGSGKAEKINTRNICELFKLQVIRSNGYKLAMNRLKIERKCLLYC